MDEQAGSFHRRLLDALAAAIAEEGYRATTVADIVRRARTSRRTFYEHFADKEACYVALLSEVNAEMVRQTVAAVDRHAPYPDQVRQAVEAWIACAEAEPALVLGWIRDMPTLGESARALQRELMAELITMVRALGDSEQWRAAGAGPVSREVAVILIGGLHELVATTVEDGGRIADITDTAVRATLALLTPHER